MSAIATTWPAALPLPTLDCDGQSEHRTLVSNLQFPRIQRRSRGASSSLTLGMRWTFTIEQYDVFRSFFSTTLGNGAACFLLELRYPSQDELTVWQVRFLSSLDVSPVDAYCVVGADLYLIRIDQEQGTPFMVVSGNTSEPLHVSPNTAYYVRTL